MDDDDDDDDDIVMRLPIPNLNYCEKDSLAYEGDKSVMRVEWSGEDMYACMSVNKLTLHVIIIIIIGNRNALHLSCFSAPLVAWVISIRKDEQLDAAYASRVYMSQYFSMNALILLQANNKGIGQ